MGENARTVDLDANVTEGKNWTDIRQSTVDLAIRLTSQRELNLEQAIEFIRGHELLEVTPRSIRLRIPGANQRLERAHD